MGRLRLPLVLSLLCLAQVLVLAQPVSYNFGPEANARIRRQVSQREVVREKSDIRVRQEIRELEKDQDVWNLYLLGLSMMQSTDMQSQTSWFSIAGLFPMVSPSKDCTDCYLTV